MDRNTELQNTIVSKDSQIRRQQDEIIKLKHDYDGMLMTRLGEGTSQMQLEQCEDIVTNKVHKKSRFRAAL